MRTSNGQLATIIAVALAAGASAQNRVGPQPAEAGRVVVGRLTQAEVKHPLTLRAGQTVRIAARSRDFDPMLKLYGPTGADALVTDDDSGGGTTAELTYTAERAGTYQIGVSVSGDAEESSTERARPYDLTVVAATTPVLAAARPIAPNAERPTPIDMAECGSGCRFTFTAAAGDRLIAETSGDRNDADPVLELYRGSEKLAEDDDSGEGVNARIVRRIDQAGSYSILVKSYQNHAGQFALNVGLRQHTSRPAAPLAAGTPVSGRLSNDAEISDEARYYDAYTLHGRAGQRVAIDMASTDFDTVLELWGPTVLGPKQLATNDDADGTPGHRATTTNSHLDVTFAQDGDVEVRALSLDHQGAYTLRVGTPPAR